MFLNLRSSRLWSINWPEAGGKGVVKGVEAGKGEGGGGRHGIPVL